MAPEESAPVALARRLLGPVLSVRPGETVTIESWNHTLSYAAACVAEARQRGAYPLLLLEDEAAFWRSVDGGPPSSRGPGLGAHELAALGRTDAYVYFPGPADHPRLRSIAPAVKGSLRKDEERWQRAAARSGLRAVRCALGYASEAQAAFWGVSATTWRGQLLRAALEPDLAALGREGRRAAETLRRGRVVRVTAANGTDLSLRLRGRPPALDDGVVDPRDRRSGQFVAAVPPGNVVVAVDEKSAEGIVVGSRPSYLGTGRADGGQWEVAAGRVTNAWFTQGHDRFEEQFAAAPKGHDILGLFAVGLNPAVAPGTPQVEDQEAGAVTLAVGGNKAWGGSNACPYLAWIVVGEATVAVDGRPLLDRGKLL
jgi:leucyl aminopeptidase (aminopeptidase T)